MPARLARYPRENNAACAVFTDSLLGAPLARAGTAPVAILLSVGSFLKAAHASGPAPPLPVVELTGPTGRELTEGTVTPASERAAL
jgi:hypothetical protein